MIPLMFAVDSEGKKFISNITGQYFFVDTSGKYIHLIGRSEKYNLIGITSIDN
jgi:hypothetical protein